MNEDFVTLDIAKKLKSKGFKEKCLAHYDCYGVLSPSTYIETWDANNCEDLDYTFFLRSFNEGLLDTIGIVYDAPTIAQVLKWLREEKKLYIEIWWLTQHTTKNLKGFQFVVTPICENPQRETDLELYCDYETAAIKGIEYVLNNLI